MPIEALLIPLICIPIGVLLGLAAIKFTIWKARRDRRKLYRRSENPPATFPRRPASVKNQHPVRKTRAKVGHGRRLRVPPKTF